MPDSKEYLHTLLDTAISTPAGKVINFEALRRFLEATIEHCGENTSQKLDTHTKKNVQQTSDHRTQPSTIKNPVSANSSEQKTQKSNTNQKLQVGAEKQVQINENEECKVEFDLSMKSPAKFENRLSKAEIFRGTTLKTPNDKLVRSKSSPELSALNMHVGSSSQNPDTQTKIHLKLEIEANINNSDRKVKPNSRTESTSRVDEQAEQLTTDPTFKTESGVKSSDKRSEPKQPLVRTVKANSKQANRQTSKSSKHVKIPFKPELRGTKIEKTIHKMRDKSSTDDLRLSKKI